MTRTALLNCAIKAEIRAVAGQSGQFCYIYDYENNGVSDGENNNTIKNNNDNYSDSDRDNHNYDNDNNSDNFDQGVPCISLHMSPL